MTFPARLVSIPGRALLLVAIAASGLTGALAQATDPGELEFMHNCAACHGRSGEGNGPVAEYLIAEVPDLTRLTQGNNGSFPRIEVHEIIDGRRILGAHGSRSMPVWGNRFSAEGLWAVDPAAGRDADTVARDRIVRIVDYIESIQTGR